MRVLCLLFQRLPIELALRARPALRGRPLALIAGHGGDALVTAATADLTARGIIPGMPAIEARERAPEARFAPDNAGACLDELERVSAIVRAKAAGKALEHALGLYADPAAWAQLVRNGMAADFSWTRQAAAYVEVYRRLVGDAAAPTGDRPG